MGQSILLLPPPHPLPLALLLPTFSSCCNVPLHAAMHAHFLFPLDNAGIAGCARHSGHLRD